MEPPSSQEEDIATEKAVLSVKGMTCAACVATIESYVGCQDGVVNVSVALLAERAEVVFKPDEISPEQIKDAIDDVGFEGEVLECHKGNAKEDKERTLESAKREAEQRQLQLDSLSKREELIKIKRDLQISLAFAFPVFLVGMVLHRIDGRWWWWWWWWCFFFLPQSSKCGGVSCCMYVS